MEYSVLDNLILIELDKVKPENIERLLIDNGLNDSLCHKKLADMKARGIDKLYVDAKTFETFAAMRRDNVGTVCFEQSFLFELLDKKGIKFEGQKKRYKNAGSAKLNIDDILEKVNESGIKSLTKAEWEVLNKAQF